MTQDAREPLGVGDTGRDGEGAALAKPREQDAGGAEAIDRVLEELEALCGEMR